jgi:hypothetical protein
MGEIEEISGDFGEPFGFDTTPCIDRADKFDTKPDYLTIILAHPCDLLRTLLKDKYREISTREHHPRKHISTHRNLQEPTWNRPCSRSGHCRIRGID